MTLFDYLADDDDAADKPKSGARSHSKADSDTHAGDASNEGADAHLEPADTAGAGSSADPHRVADEDADAYAQPGDATGVGANVPDGSAVGAGKDDDVQSADTAGPGDRAQADIAAGEVPESSSRPVAKLGEDQQDSAARLHAASMEIRLHGGPIKASYLTGLFWSLQAAVRDAGDDAELLTGYTTRRGPFLVVGVEPNAGDDDHGFTLRLWFANEHDRPLPNRTRAIFKEFFAEIETAARRGNQHTFWGRPAVPHVGSNDESRMQRFLSILRTFEGATIVFADYRLTLINGSIRLERGMRMRRGDGVGIARADRVRMCPRYPAETRPADARVCAKVS